MKEKLINVLKTIFAVTIILCLAVGFLVACGFLVAMIVGGEFAANLCTAMSKYLIPTLYVVGASTTFVGLAKMYIAGEKAFVMEKLQWNKKQNP